jgi:hypothetical protein
LSDADIRDIIISADVSKAMGPDMIGNRVLKLAETSLTPIFNKLFNLSLKQSVSPSIWKEASVIPIHKKGSVNDCSNYRPVAFTSYITKLFKKINVSLNTHLTI